MSGLRFFALPRALFGSASCLPSPQSADARRGHVTMRPFDDFRKLGIIDRTALACRIFGRSRVENAIARVVDIAVSWGYGRFQAKDAQWAVCTVILANKSRRREDLTLEVLEEER